MSVINKELYDALISANVPEDKATAAARSESLLRTDIDEIKTRVAAIETRIAVTETRLALAEKLQWSIFLGVVGLLIKAFLSG